MLSALFVLQLVFVESGYACSMSHMGSDMDAMGAMSMPQTGHADAPTPANNQAPCRFPWAPGGCHSMAPCAPAALVTATPALADPPAFVAAVPVLAVLTPPSTTAPPDLPPPRL